MLLRSFKVLLSCLLCSLGFYPKARAHVIDQVYAELRAEGKAYNIRIVIDAGYCLPEYRGDKDAPAPDTAWINGLSEEEHTNLREEAESYLRTALILSQGGERIDYSLSFPDYETKPYKFYESMFSTPTLRVTLDG